MKKSKLAIAGALLVGAAAVFATTSCDMTNPAPTEEEMKQEMYWQILEEIDKDYKGKRRDHTVLSPSNLVALPKNANIDSLNGSKGPGIELHPDMDKYLNQYTVNAELEDLNDTAGAGLPIGDVGITAAAACIGEITSQYQSRLQTVDREQCGYSLFQYVLIINDICVYIKDNLNTEEDLQPENLEVFKQTFAQKRKNVDLALKIMLEFVKTNGQMNLSRLPYTNVTSYLNRIPTYVEFLEKVRDKGLSFKTEDVLSRSGRVLYDGEENDYQFEGAFADRFERMASNNDGRYGNRYQDFLGNDLHQDYRYNGETNTLESPTGRSVVDLESLHAEYAEYADRSNW